MRVYLDLKYHFVHSNSISFRIDEKLTDDAVSLIFFACLFLIFLTSSSSSITVILSANNFKLGFGY